MASSRTSWVKGTLRSMPAASLPSASIQLAPRCTPTASSSVDSLTPVKLSTLLRSEEHTSELQSQSNLVCRLLLEKKKKKQKKTFKNSYRPYIRDDSLH